LTDEVRQKLRHISAATIDRLLATEKKKLKIKGKGLIAGFDIDRNVGRNLTLPTT